MHTKPQQTTGLTGSDIEVQRIADELWARCGSGLARDVWSARARAGTAGGFHPTDFEFEQAPAGTIDYIHYTVRATDIYFVSNQSALPLQFPALFRVRVRRPNYGTR